MSDLNSGSKRDRSISGSQRKVQFEPSSITKSEKKARTSDEKARKKLEGEIKVLRRKMQQLMDKPVKNSEEEHEENEITKEFNEKRQRL